MSDPTAFVPWTSAAVHDALAGLPGVGAVHYEAELDSTIDAAWQREDLADVGLAVVADAQRRGRGRAGRLWHSPPGTGLWLSWLFRPGFDPRAWLPLPLVAGIATARAVDPFGVRLLLKWPNDLVAPDGSFHKVGGVLAESRRGDGRPAIVLSLGLNVLGRSAGLPPEIRETATTLEELVGVRPDRLAVLRAVVSAWSAAVREVQERGPGGLLDAWRGRSAVLGRVVRLREGVAEIEGVARDVDEDGALVVRLESGAEMLVRAGDVEVRWGQGA